MRRWIGIIGIALGTVAMHGGKWAAYAYCRLQMSVVLQQADCDCAKVLTSDDEPANDGRDAAAGLLKPSSDLFGCTFAAAVPVSPFPLASSGTDASVSLLFPGNLHGVFRPPVIG
jgi:hypothetical protein